jgi:hypothetical protein
VHDGAVGIVVPAELAGAERLLEEIDDALGTLDQQVWRDAGIAFGLRWGVDG